MKKILLNSVLSTCLFSASAFSAYDIHSLQNVKDIASALYSTGQDNNYLDAKVYSQKEFQKLFSNKISFIENTSVLSEKVDTILRECLFYATGAYGDHLSADQQAQLARNFQYDVLQNFSGKVFKIDGQFLINDFAIFSSPCGFAYQVGKKVLVLQGVSVD